MTLRPRRFTLLCLGLVAAVAAGLFAPSLRDGFAYDSQDQVLYGDFIHQPRFFPAVLTFRVMAMDVLDFNRPVELASLMTDSLVWGRNPFGYHLTNILLHAAAAGLCFVLLRRLAGAGGWGTAAAALGALVFAVHPLMTEAVCEPSNRKDILATIFALGAVLVMSGRTAAWGRVALAGFLTLLAVGAKEVGAAVPVMIFLYWAIFRPGGPRRYWIGGTAVSAAVVIVFLTARFSLAHRPSEIFVDPPIYPDGSLGGAMLIQPRILALYVCNVCWPAQLCADYNGYSLRHLPLALSAGLLLAAGGALAWGAWHDRRAAFGAGIVLAALLPVCNLVPIYCAAADRYLYLPMAGVALIVLATLDRSWLARRAGWRNAAAGATLLVVAALACVTWQREKVWTDAMTLWTATRAENPPSHHAWSGYAGELLAADRFAEARGVYETMLRGPWADDATTWAHYAVVLDGLGQWDAAARVARHALVLKPDLIDTGKMIRTLQVEPRVAGAFARVAAAPPP